MRGNTIYQWSGSEFTQDFEYINAVSDDRNKRKKDMKLNILRKTDDVNCSDVFRSCWPLRKFVEVKRATAWWLAWGLQPDAQTSVRWLSAARIDDRKVAWPTQGENKCSSFLLLLFSTPACRRNCAWATTTELSYNKKAKKTVETTSTAAAAAARRTQHRSPKSIKSRLLNTASKPNADYDSSFGIYMLHI